MSSSSDASSSSSSSSSLAAPTPKVPGAVPSISLFTSSVTSLRYFMKEHPFQSVLGVWGSVLAGTGAYLYSRDMPFQLKVIQARIVAQATLLLGAGTFGLVHFLTDDMDKEHAPAASTWVLRDYSTHGTHNPPPTSAPSNDKKLQ